MSKARVSVGTAPTGTTTIDIKRNGTSIFATPGVTIPVAGVTQTKTPDAGSVLGSVAQVSPVNGNFAAAPASGSVLVLFAGCFDTTPPTDLTVTGCGATWTKLARVASGGSNNRDGFIYIGLNPSGASNALSVVSSAGYQWVAYEVTGVVSEIPAAGHFGTVAPVSAGTSLAPPTLTPTEVGDVLLACLVEANSDVSSITAGWTDDGGNGTWAHGAHRIAASTAAQAPTYTWPAVNYAVAMDVYLRAVTQTAAIAPGDYLTVDVTAADGTAADLSVQVTLT